MRTAVLKHRAKRWLAAGAAALGPPRRTTDGATPIPILLYHTLEPGHASAIPPDRFERQMAWLGERYTVVPVGELNDRLTGASPPKPLAAVTFDDGFADNHTHALPVLERLGLRASFFVCTDFTEGTQDITRGFRHYRGLAPMNVAAVRDLAAAGMEIGAHTRTHPLLAGLPHDAQEREIAGSQERIAAWLGALPRSFAVPFGTRATFDDATLAIVRARFTVCCTSLLGTMRADEITGTPCPLLRRIEVSPLDTAVDFAAKARGDWDVLAAFQRRDHAGARAAARGRYGRSGAGGP